MTTPDVRATLAGSDVEVVLHLELHVGVVEIRRPPNNYLSVPVLDGVLEGIDTLVGEGCRAVVLRSDGKHFSAGRDFSASRLPGDAPEDMYERAARLFASPVPIVAEVQGAAIGAGLGLAAIADFRVVSQRAYFWANFVRLGTHPGFGLSLTLPGIVGQQRARWMFSTGHRVNAETALQWGLADRVVPATEMKAAGVELAAELAAVSPAALSALRRTLRTQEAHKSFLAATRHEAGEQARLRESSISSGRATPHRLSPNSSPDEEPV
jgi:2-(1,2-epoxy-1,2-dihydrophenyl)acetyl-CoA isomerase